MRPAQHIAEAVAQGRAQLLLLADEQARAVRNDFDAVRTGRGTTVTIAVSLTGVPPDPLAVATMPTPPTPIARTIPVPLTVATEPFSEVHAIGRPGSATTPPASFATAPSCVESPSSPRQRPA